MHGEVVRLRRGDAFDGKVGVRRIGAKLIVEPNLETLDREVGIQRLRRCSEALSMIAELRGEEFGLCRPVGGDRHLGADAGGPAEAPGQCRIDRPDGGVAHQRHAGKLRAL